MAIELISDISDEEPQTALNTGLISPKFVPLGKRDRVVNNLCLSIKEFRRKLRWKYFFMNQKEEETSQITFNEAFIESQVGLNTGFKIKPTNAPLAPPDVEKFFKQLATDLFENIRQNPRGLNDPNQVQARTVLSHLAATPDTILAPTDKTNRFVKMKLSAYEALLLDQIEENSKIVDRQVIQNAIDEALKMVEEADSELELSDREKGFIREGLRQKAVPEFQGLLKDHKEQLSMRLIVPCCNSFLANFKRVLARGLENIFKEQKVNFDFLLVNSIDLKNKLESLKILKKSTIASIDVKSMYPSISPNLTRTAIDHYMLRYKFSTQARIKVGFILSSLDKLRKYNFVRHRDQFYRYVGADEDAEGLAMGDFESSYVADLTINYVYLKLAEEGIFDEAIFSRTYRDDGIIIFDGLRTKDWLLDWEIRLKTASKNISDGRINFTMETGTELNFLDMTLFFVENQLKFKIFRKPNQQLLYLNSDSMHYRAHVDNIFDGVMKRLVRLTSDLPEKFMPSTYFPDHIKALKNANLLTEKEEKKSISKSSYCEDAVSKKSKRDHRKINFIMPAMGPWLTKTVHTIITKNLKAFKLKGKIRFSIIYKKCANLGSLIRNDIKNKINTDIRDENYVAESCNCHGKKEGSCDVGGDCRKKAVIYKMTCQVRGCQKVYIGSTIRNAKERVREHIYALKKLVISEKKAQDGNGDSTLNRSSGRKKKDLTKDAFTRHMLEHQHFRDELLKEPDKNLLKAIRKNVVSEIYRECRTENIGSERCGVCRDERIAIFQAGDTAMNRRTELFTECPHQSRLIKPIKI